MPRPVTRLVIGAILAAALVPVAASPAATQGVDHRCPAMSDSITRLYQAYFDRLPDRPGFDHWIGLYATGSQSLEEISQEMADSEEFNRNGRLSNPSFVDWIYANVLETTPDPDERARWVEALDGGTRRGTVMLSFTESAEFVDLTDTEPPLAGYLNWYPAGTHWYCDIGDGAFWTRPLDGEVWADYLFSNRSDGADDIALWTREADGSRAVRMVDATLAPGHTDYNWDGVFSGDGDYGEQIEVRAGSETDWIVVFYPTSLGPQRLGWQLD